jgi:Spx/MgsR family transcriptional regulator
VVVSRVTLYGISNCDTMRKTRRWLDARGIDFDFHDYRNQGLDGSLLQSLEARLGWQVLLNRKGRSWRALDESTRQAVDRESALELMLANPALIKRPVLATGKGVAAGYDEAGFEALLD